MRSCWDEGHHFCIGDSFVNSLQRLVARFIFVVGKKVKSRMVFIWLVVSNIFYVHPYLGKMNPF